MHRTDLPASTFIDAANAQVGRDFRTTDNTLTALLPGPAPLALPTDFKEMIWVSAEGPSGPYSLVSVGSGNALDWLAVNSGYPFGYRVDGLEITPIPASDGDLTVNYYAALALGALTSDTNALLNAYQQAYLWYCLFQASLYIQDREGATQYLELYQYEKREANAVNRQKVQPVAGPLLTTATIPTAT